GRSEPRGKPSSHGRSGEPRRGVSSGAMARHQARVLNEFVEEPEASGPEISTRDLRAFVLVAKERSYTRAAEQLGYSEPAIHYQIRHLESTLGCTLISKVGRRPDLTPRGRRILAHCEAVMVSVSAMDAIARDPEDARSVSIVCGPTTYRYWVPPL